MDNRTCPVCGIQPSQELNNCSQCGWDLSSVFGLSAKVHAEYQTKLERAKAAWQARVASRLTHLARYIDHMDGTLTDVQTGLMWMKPSAGQHWLEGKVVGEAETFTWEQACQQNCTCFAGYDDWRLPSIEELKTLVFCSLSKRKSFRAESHGCLCLGKDFQSPTIDLCAFPRTPAVRFWSSLLDATSTSAFAWYVSFLDSYVGSGYKGNYCGVRLVRAGQ